MRAKVGLIQAGGIGDIIIALPIADHFIEEGFDVFWPVRPEFAPFFQAARPAVHFIPIPPRGHITYDEPLRILTQLGCERIHSLYSYVGDRKVTHEKLARHLKFDEYKYAVCGVPFDRKWALRIERDSARERALRDRLHLSGPYICVHDTGSDFRAVVPLPEEWTRTHQVVAISAMSDNPFDWLLTLEGASKLVLLDSCFANLVEQLNLPNEKYVMLRSSVAYTPVFRNRWHFILLDQAAPGTPPT